MMRIGSMLESGRTARATVLVMAWMCLAGGCQSIEISRASPEAVAAAARATILTGDDVSVVTRQILHSRSIHGYRTDPVAAIRQLDAEMRETHDRHLAAAIAELGYVQKRRWTNVDYRALATTIRYAYAYLFDPRLEPQPSTYDARFREMCDLYNAAIADWVRTEKQTPSRWGSDVELNWIGGAGAAHVARNDLAWDFEEFENVHVAADFVVEGLEPPAMRRGIGVPCLVSRAWNRSAALSGQQRYEHRFLPKQVSFPMTLVVRWPDDCSILDVPHAEALVEVIDPIQSITVPIAGDSVPIEVDYTTPVAVMVASTKPPSGIDALLHTDKFAKRSGFVMFQPYRADRIMVLFVHGLASGPETWLPLYNRLLADETIRTRFQFAFWFYPTGEPAMRSAANFRKALVEARTVLADEGHPEFRSDGVVCAHSLGGVISSTLVTDSGDLLWNTAFTVPPEQLPVSEDKRRFLEEALIFKHQPFVKRVVYYATPHRGSPEANAGIVQWASGLIRLPGAILGEDAKLRKYLQEGVRSKRYTVAQSLQAHNPILEALIDDLPVVPGVIYHSIIGDEKEAGRTDGSDGLVPYWSSHVDGAASEVVFKSGHSVQHTPEAARETRRILLEHLKAIEAE